jgi:hypothetical protein
MPNRSPNKAHGLRRACLCEIDFVRINAEALKQIRPLLSAFVPGASLPDFLTAEAAGGGSFVDDRTGQWAHVGTGERGEDLISLVAFLLRLNRRQSAKFIAGLLGIPWGPLQ